MKKVMSRQMIISEVQIEFIKPQNGLIGFASFVVDGSFYISSIAIHTKLNGEGYRLTYPSKGNFTICHPINKQVSKEIEAAIFSKLNDVMKKVKSDAENTF
jgi:DNA-binding cell septation regulator SpoVG